MTMAILSVQERAFVSNPRRKCNRSKRKSLQMNALNPHNIQKNGGFLSRSESFVGTENLGSKNLWLQKPNGTAHQASRTFSYNGSGEFHPEAVQNGVRNFLLDKNEGGFRKVANDLQMGQVNVFKRGEAIKSASLSESTLTHLLEIPEKSITVKASKREAKISGKSKVSDGISITSSERFGPDPCNLPREGSGLLKSVSSGLASAETVVDNAPRGCWEAVDNLKVGVFAFTNSPPPSCLPLPKFSLKQNGRPATTQVAVNTLATRDLRRLLGLD